MKHQTRYRDGKQPVPCPPILVSHEGPRSDRGHTDDGNQACQSEHPSPKPVARKHAGKIDRVLVDAPCTGFGTLRRNPDLKWRQPESAVSELAAKQRAILAAAATLVKPGGRIVYATCSVLPDENEAVVDAFLAANRGFATGNAAAELARAGIALDTGPALKLRTHEHGCDGFYAAVLTRIL